jgi:hypothetical protein
MTSISIPYSVNVNKDSSLHQADSQIITNIAKHHSALIFRVEQAIYVSPQHKIPEDFNFTTSTARTSNHAKSNKFIYEVQAPM